MATSEEGKAPAHKIKRIEPVVKSSNVQARVLTLAPGEAIPWHYHRESTDHTSCSKVSFRSQRATRIPGSGACRLEAAIGLRPERRI